MDETRNIKLLSKLAEVYIGAKDYSMAELIVNRMTEIQPNDATSYAKIGAIKLYKNELQEASKWFKKALSINKSDPLGVYGMAGLEKRFGFKSRLRQTLKNARKKPKPGRFIHPIIKSAL